MFGQVSAESVPGISGQGRAVSTHIMSDLCVPRLKILNPSQGLFLLDQFSEGLSLIERVG